MSSEVIDQRPYFPSLAELQEDAVAHGPPMTQREGYSGIPYPWGVQCKLPPALPQTQPQRQGGMPRLNRRRF